MKATITVHIPVGAGILVKEGDEVSETSILAKVDEEEETTPLDVAKLLKTKPSTLTKYLKVNIGDTISVGDPIALRKSLMSSVLVKSPLAGTLVSVDLTTGSLIFRTKQSFPKKVLSPIAGKIQSIKSKTVDIEADVVSFETEKGGGEKVRGILQFITEGEAGVLGGKREEMEGSIVMAGSITDATNVKYEVLGVVGIIVEKLPSFSINLPYVQVEKSVFKKISGFDGRMAVLDPEHKRVYFME